MSMNKKGLRQLSAVILIPLLIISVFSFSVPVHAIEGEQHFTSEQMITVSFRVEGSAGSIYPKGDVQVPAGSTVFDVMQEALNSASIYFHVDTSGLFAYVTQIGDDEQSQFGVWDGWQYLVNGVKPWDAVDSYYVQQDDDIYFYYGNIGEMYLGRAEADEVDKLTLIPEIEVLPSNPASGQELQIKVTAKYDIYDEDYDLVASGVEANIEGASVYFNGQSYVTNGNGLVTIPAAFVAPGEYELRVAKDVSGSYPRLVRTEKDIVIGVAVQLEEVPLY